MSIIDYNYKNSGWYYKDNDWNDISYGVCSFNLGVLKEQEEFRKESIYELYKKDYHKNYPF